MLTAQRTIASALVARGWGFADVDALTLAETHPCPCAWSAQSGSSSVGRPLGGPELQAVMQSPEVLAVAEGEEISEIFQRIFGERSSTLDMKWLRAMCKYPVWVQIISCPSAFLSGKDESSP